MKSRFRLFRRGQTFYAHDGVTGQQMSLRTTDKGEATALLHSKNEAYRQPNLNLQLARTYLSASDPQTMKRTWQMVMTEMSATKTSPALARNIPCIGLVSKESGTAGGRVAKASNPSITSPFGAWPLDSPDGWAHCSINPARYRRFAAARFVAPASLEKIVQLTLKPRRK